MKLSVHCLVSGFLLLGLVDSSNAQERAPAPEIKSLWESRGKQPEEAPLPKEAVRIGTARFNISVSGVRRDDEVLAYANGQEIGRAAVDKGLFSFLTSRELRPGRYRLTVRVVRNGDASNPSKAVSIDYFPIPKIETMDAFPHVPARW